MYLSLMEVSEEESRIGTLKKEQSGVFLSLIENA
jgi:hypothetical protein